MSQLLIAYENLLILMRTKLLTAIMHSLLESGPNVQSVRFEFLQQYLTNFCSKL